MDFASSLGLMLGNTTLATIAGGYALAVVALVSYIWIRRIVRARYFARRDMRSYRVRKEWPQILTLAVPPERWRNDPLDREVVETILLDSLDAASEEELPPLLGFLRKSGLLDVRLHEARTSEGWRQRTALVALGRTRAPEGIAPLVDVLNFPDIDLRTAAVRGLGAIGLPEAAAPILERLSTGELDVPAAAISTALVQGCRHDPQRLLRYFHLTRGKSRELLARVLAELEVSLLGEELISLAKDESAEVRACAARGLPKLHPSIAVPVLTELTEDECWFVRLRAVVSLGSMDAPDAVEPLAKMLRDPNRLVRQRTAAALVRHSDQLGSILVDAVAQGDNYGLQALVSEIERDEKSQGILHAAGDRNLSVANAITQAREQLGGREGAKLGSKQ